MRGTGHVANVGIKRNSYKDLAGEPKEKRQLGSQKHK
jgi:hypothetical protein